MTTMDRINNAINIYEANGGEVNALEVLSTCCTQLLWDREDVYAHFSNGEEGSFDLLDSKDAAYLKSIKVKSVAIYHDNGDIMIYLKEVER